MLQIIKNFILAFCAEVLELTVRGPLLVVVLSPLIASTGAWQYLASSWSASDTKRAAAWSELNTRLPTIAVVAIDETGYQSYFDSKSPIDRDRVEALLRVVDEHSKATKRITIDLDLSPVPGQEAGQAKLDQLILQNPQRWVLAAVNAGSEADIANVRQWRKQLCAQGVSFGLPYVPNEFGYPKLTHQYKDGLADMSLQPPGTCSDPDTPKEQRAMALAPSVLDASLIIPFNGDLDALAQVLDYIEADWIFVGGAWGDYDVFGTPFGERFGVQIHLAALAGALSHEREAENVISLIICFFFVSLCTVVLKYMDIGFDRLFHPPTPKMVGHTFYLQRLQPIQFVFVVFVFLAAFTEASSILRAWTGYWIPSSIVSCTTVGMLLLTWNWGQNKAEHYDDFKHLWLEKAWHPIELELRSLLASFSVVRHGHSATAWGVGTEKIGVGRGRALLEGLFTTISLGAQTLLPAGTILYALAHAVFGIGGDS